MPSFLEREQLTPVAPYIAPADQILGAFNTRQSLFGIGEAQAQSAYNSYSNMPLTNSQNQQQLDGLMKTATTELKTATMRDLSVGDNQSKAMQVFDPIVKDQDIMGDSALTQGWNKGLARAEQDKTSNGGKNYNQSASDAINYQRALFSRADKSTWRSFYNNKEEYTPYYDTYGETKKLADSFKTDVIEKDSQNGAYITTTKDSSWYKDKWQQYFETNASPQLKAQIGQQARADYYRDMLTMPKEALVQKYTDMRNALIRKQMYVDSQNMMNIGAQLALKHDSKDNAPLRAQLTTQAKYLNDAYDAKKQALNSALEGGDAIGTIEGLATGSRIAEGLAQYNYFDKIGDAFAHKEEKFSIKPDYAYLSLAKIKEQSREFGIRETETARHNKADELHNTNMEGIDMIKAQADLLRANKEGKTQSEEYDFVAGTGPGGGLVSSSGVGGGSNSEATQTQGSAILDNLANTQKKYDAIYDQISSTVFSKNIMDEVERNANDPAKQNMSLRNIADPTRAADGTGGNAERLAKFLVATGQLNEDPAGKVLGSIMGDTERYDPMTTALDMPISQVKTMLRQVWSDPAMFKKAMEAVKGNDPSVNTYAIASQIEKMKQRIDGEHADIVNQAVPILRTNLGKYASLFEADYFSKGKIPTRDEIRGVMNSVPLSALKDEITASEIPLGPKFQHQIGLKSTDDLFRDVETDKLAKIVMGTLGNNRTAYNSQFQDYGFGRQPKQEAGFQNSLRILIDGAEGATKGHPEYEKVLKYANDYPGSVKGIRVNTVDEANNTPTFQVFFKEPTNKDEKADIPESGVRIPTTNASGKFNAAPLDDRTTLLNNKALKFQTTYADGTKSNLSIYNTTGSKENPQFDINPDFSYQALNIDKQGNIQGIITVHKSDEVNALTQGRPYIFSQMISQDPSQVYDVLANKLIKNRDAVNEYLNAKGSIKTINDLPDYLKNALRNNSF